ncbi:Excalibur calcium-binding domain protein [compost metagenome]
MYTNQKFISGVALSLLYILFFFFNYFKKNRKSFQMLENYKNLIQDGAGYLMIVSGIVCVIAIINEYGENTTFNQDIYFENCTDAFSKGYYNIYEHEPGYRYELDRDNDGIACEG